MTPEERKAAVKAGAEKALQVVATTLKTYKTTAEQSAEIRETLKREHGWSSRQVSVKSHVYSMGSSINVTIKDPAIPLSVVKAIAEKAEHIRYDEYAGEILSGGNQFVFVKYSQEAEEALAAPYVEAAREAIAAIKENYLERVGSTPFLVGHGQNSYLVTVWHEDVGHVAQTDSAQGAALIIGRRAP
jgi:hypothetical protein